MTPLQQIIDRLNSGIELNENILNNKANSNIERNRSSYTLNVLKSFKAQSEEMLEEEKRYITKANKWDKLDEEIGKYYENDIDDDEENEDEENEGSLLDIGETAAIAFGYL